MKIRLQKLLAGAGVASRRGAEALIARGDVAVNGVIAQLGDSADPETDSVEVQGRPLPLPLARHTYLALNKPRGVVTTLQATHGETTVADYVHTARRVFPVGRLDKETSGLLLFTDDGNWANLVTHPRYEIEKEYHALVRGRLGQDVVPALEAGVTLPDGTKTAPARVRPISDDGEKMSLSITVIEGKKRQIRLMMASVGHPVVELERVRVGPIRLGELSEGEMRVLHDEEVEAIRERARAVAPDSR